MGSASLKPAYPQRSLTKDWSFVCVPRIKVSAVLSARVTVLATVL